jgi:D-alanine-D-alanine ligase-like ATP-grasp enzyme
LVKRELEAWFQTTNLSKENGKVIVSDGFFSHLKDCFMVGCEEVTSDVLSQVKPTRAGSSIGVVVAYGVNDAAQKAEEIISKVQNTF